MAQLSSPLEKILGYQMRRASAANLADLNDSLAEIGLRITESSILIAIEARPGIKQSELGRMFGIKSANMAPLIATLDDRGLIERRQLDGRSQGLYVTDAGLEACKQVWSRIEENDTRYFSKLTEQERAWLSKLFAAMWR